MSKTWLAAAVVCIASGIVNVLSAQQGAGPVVASQVAIMRTPIGALPPGASRQMRVAPEQTTSFRAQYGYLGGTGAFNFSNFGFGVDLPYGRGTLGLTIGYTAPSCPEAFDCDGNLMLGASLERRLVGVSLGTGAEAAGLTIGVDAAAGYAAPDETSGLGDDASLWSAGLGLPLALNAGSGRVRFHPFLTPRFAWGRLRNDLGGDSGAGFLIGGGVGVSGLARGIVVSAGFQRYTAPVSNAQLGVGVTMAPGR